MLEGGEDARFIVRRMVILASEDIGNADPAALTLASAAAAAVEHVGLPEARYALAQAAIYLALAPKSDAAGRALSAAQAPRARARRGRAAAVAALGAAPGTGPRRLREPPRPARARPLAGARAAGARGRALLRARRGRGGARAASGGGSPGARARAAIIACRDEHSSVRDSASGGAPRARPGKRCGDRQRRRDGAGADRRDRAGGREGAATVGAAARAGPRPLHAPHGAVGDRRLRRARDGARRASRAARVRRSLRSSCSRRSTR